MLVALLPITENTEIKQPRATEKYKKNSKAFFSVALGISSPCSL